MKYTLILILFLIKFSSFSQELFQIKYTLNQPTQLSEALALEDSNYYFFGRYYLPLILKTDRRGDISWLKEYQIDYQGQSATGLRSIKTKSNQLVVLTNILWYLLNTEYSIPVIGKIDTSGNILFLKAFSITENDYINNVIATSDGGFIAVGSLNKDRPFDPLIGAGFLLKLDVNLTQQWCKVYYDSTQIQVSNITELPDSGFVVSGVSKINGYNYWTIFRTDKTGNQYWCKSKSITTIQEFPSEVSQFLDIGKDNNIVCAYNGSSTILPGDDVLFAKMDLNGNLLWHKVQGDMGSDQVYQIISLPDSGYWLNYGNVMRRYSVNGDVLYANSFNVGSYLSIGNKEKTFDGGYIAGGIVDNPNKNMIIIKTDSNYLSYCSNQPFFNNFSLNTGGSLIDHILYDSLAVFNEDSVSWIIYDSIPSKIILCSNVNDVSLNQNELQIDVYPNPFINSITICNIQTLTEASVYNLSGIEIDRFSLTENCNNLNLAKLHPGIYLLKIYSNKSTITIKLIKAHYDD